MVLKSTNVVKAIETALKVISFTATLGLSDDFNCVQGQIKREYTMINGLTKCSIDNWNIEIEVCNRDCHKKESRTTQDGVLEITERIVNRKFDEGLNITVFLKDKQEVQAFKEQLSKFSKFKDQVSNFLGDE